MPMTHSTTPKVMPRIEKLEFFMYLFTTGAKIRPKMAPMTIEAMNRTAIVVYNVKATAWSTVTPAGSAVDWIAFRMSLV